MIVVTSEEMRALDEATIGGLGVPGVVLMESAGRAVFAAIAARGALAGRRIAIVCGPGNNGGDGFVVARHLHHHGADVAVLLVAGEPRPGPGSGPTPRGDARVHFEAMQRSGVRVLDAGPEGWSASAAAVGRAEVIVDAILGTGGARTVTGHLADVIRHMNAAAGARIAVDLPSGLDADSGHPRGVCVRAEETVTLAFAKVGLVTAPGYTYCGRLTVADIGIPEVLARARGVRTHLLEESDLGFLDAPRHPLSHKGTYGHLVVVAGSRGHPGAALMCGEAAMRAGAGLVTIAAPDETEAALSQRVLEVSTRAIGPQPETVQQGEEAWGRMAGWMRGKQAVAFGPGVAPTPGMRAFLLGLLSAWEGPLVIDADGLNLLAQDPAPLASTRAQVVLTPHPAEMGRLAGLATAEVQADRVGVARAFATRHGAVVVLKGARTVIAAPDGTVAINPTGNPGMAAGGTGDALTGIIGALLANLVTPVEAACGGAFLHGRAGDLARDAVGEIGLCTRDLIAQLPAARQSLGRGGT